MGSLLGVLAPCYSLTILPSRNHLRYHLNWLQFCLFPHFYAYFFSNLSYLNHLDLRLLHHHHFKINFVYLLINLIHPNHHQDHHPHVLSPKFHSDLHPHHHKDHYTLPLYPIFLRSFDYVPHTLIFKYIQLVNPRPAGIFVAAAVLLS